MVVLPGSSGSVGRSSVPRPACVFVSAGAWMVDGPVLLHPGDDGTSRGKIVEVGLSDCLSVYTLGVLRGSVLYL